VEADLADTGAVRVEGGERRGSPVFYSQEVGQSALDNKRHAVRQNEEGRQGIICNGLGRIEDFVDRNAKKKVDN